MHRAQSYGWTRRIARVIRAILVDRRGNALVIGAAAIIPLLGIVGGGIDMSRGYMARTRLQQACDSGVLAARKKMGSSAIVGKNLPQDVVSMGNQFFKSNFQDFAYGTTEKPKFNMSLSSDFAITGSASVKVPTAIMYLFGVKELPISATCSSQFNYSNTDLMLVLDVTGSMDSALAGAKKIDTLRKTVIGFHKAVESSKGDGVRVRYGFVPYSVNVNVAHLLQSQWIADSHTYEARQPKADGTAWIYKPITVNTKAWKGTSGTALYRGGTLDVDNVAGTYSAPESLKVTFEGCIEERKTYRIGNYNAVDLTKALDLDIDAVPNPADPSTQWKPWIRELSWLRGGARELESKIERSKPGGDQIACVPPARKLAEMTAGEVATYVNGLRTGGFTYHDIGMIWGGRLLSPTGIFAVENANVDGRPTMRHLIFLTDGTTQSAQDAYGAYGIESHSNRRWLLNENFTLTQAVEKRFSFACDAVKNKNITVWVVGFGTEVTSLMKNCSGAGRWFQANDAAQLGDAFATIAAAIGDLRITD